MKLVVDLESAEGEIHGLCHGAARVLELERVHGQIDHFQHLSIHERQPDSLQVKSEHDSWWDIFGNGFERVLAAGACVLTCDRDGSPVTGTIYTQCLIVVCDLQDLGLTIGSDIQRNCP